MQADFVIISYECNFWGMAALEALVESLELAGLDRDVYVVHNYKTTRKIDQFRADCRRARRPDAVHHAIAYEGLFEQVGNYADFERHRDYSTLAGHHYVLNWLIKYHLPEGRYVFIDHDCIVRPGFAASLAELVPELEGKLFAFPRHDEEPRSLTAPIFYCETGLRRYLGGLCDLGWSKNIVRGEREKLPRGREVFYTDSDVERAISRRNFDDSLHNVVRHLLARWPELVSRMAVVRWRECDHLWHGGTRPLPPRQAAMLGPWIDGRFRREYFRADRESSILEGLLEQLESYGLLEMFRDRFLS
jgi:hypothetical protein